MTHQSELALLVLHGTRILGFADTDRVAGRFGLDEHDVSEELLDHQARGWVTRSSFGGVGGWGLTEAGRVHDEHLLTKELDAAGARAQVEAAHADFLPLNDDVTRVCTAVQLVDGDDEVGSALDDLARAADGLATIERSVVDRLYRFAGYHQRFTHAVAQGRADRAWITGVDRDSAHRVWFELHEDLIATLGLSR